MLHCSLPGGPTCTVSCQQDEACLACISRSRRRSSSCWHKAWIPSEQPQAVLVGVCYTVQMIFRLGKFDFRLILTIFSLHL